MNRARLNGGGQTEDGTSTTSVAVVTSPTAAARAASESEDVIFHHFPIPDLTPADSVASLSMLVDDLVGLVTAGKVGSVYPTLVLCCYFSVRERGHPGIMRPLFRMFRR